MNWEEVGEIELDQRYYGSAYIILRRKNGTMVDRKKVKWEKRYQAYSLTLKQWNENKRRTNGD